MLFGLCAPITGVGEDGQVPITSLIKGKFKGLVVVPQRKTEGTYQRNQNGCWAKADVGNCIKNILCPIKLFKFLIYYKTILDKYMSSEN